MTTCATLIEQTLGELLSGMSEQQNKLAADIEDTTTSVQMTYATTAIQQGTYLDLGFEDVLVWECDQPTRTAVIERAQRGTEALPALVGQKVTINPRFSHAQVFEAINQELSALGGELYQVKTIDLTSSAVEMTYDLSGITDLLDVYAVYYDAVGPENYWPELHGWDVRRNQFAGEFGSGHALRLPANSLVPSRRLRVVYFAKFGPVASPADDVETVSGLPVNMLDIVRLGAQIRLMGVRESKRSFLESQPDTRRADEVQSGAATRAVTTLIQLRRMRIAEERSKLSAQYPLKRR